MVEIKDEEDGRIALIMDKEELPLAVGALMRAGYELTPPSDAEAEEPEAEAEEPEAEAEAEEPEAEAEEPEEPEEEYERRGPVRRRGSRARG
ncbi:MAG TPA: hypothetical protein VGI66_00125 [Streptosporangiaceae bacterium]|jgi:pyruvate/2-oxoglutarate dehydrogenase complex dihydrolipoamide acyltransferase (E2) component